MGSLLPDGFLRAAPADLLDAGFRWVFIWGTNCSVLQEKICIIDSFRFLFLLNGRVTFDSINVLLVVGVFQSPILLSFSIALGIMILHYSYDFRVDVRLGQSYNVDTYICVFQKTITIA